MFGAQAGKDECPQSRVARPGGVGQTVCWPHTHSHTLPLKHSRRESGRERERHEESGRDIQDADCDKGLVRRKNPILPGESSSHLWIFYSLPDSMARKDCCEKNENFTVSE